MVWSSGVLGGGIKSATKSVPPLHHLLAYCALPYLPKQRSESTSSSRSFERDAKEWSREQWRRKRKRTAKIHSSNEEILCSKKITKNLTGKRITVHCVLNSNPRHIAHLHKQKKQKNVALIHGTDANPIGISPCTFPASPARPRRRPRRRPWEYSSPSRT